MANVTYRNNDQNAGAVPINTVIKTTQEGSAHIQHVIVESDVGLLYDEILVTYTDATKATISKVEWKLAGVVVRTLTPTFGVADDDWVVT